MWPGVDLTGSMLGVHKRIHTHKAHTNTPRLRQHDAGISYFGDPFFFIFLLLTYLTQVLQAVRYRGHEREKDKGIQGEIKS